MVVDPLQGVQELLCGARGVLLGVEEAERVNSPHDDARGFCVVQGMECSLACLASCPLDSLLVLAAGHVARSKLRPLVQAA